MTNLKINKSIFRSTRRIMLDSGETSVSQGTRLYGERWGEPGYQVVVRCWLRQGTRLWWNVGWASVPGCGEMWGEPAYQAVVRRWLRQGIRLRWDVEWARKLRFSVFGWARVLGCVAMMGEPGYRAAMRWLVSQCTITERSYLYSFFCIYLHHWVRVLGCGQDDRCLPIE